MGDKMKDYGSIKVKLDEVLKNSDLSKNELSYRAEMQRTQLNKFCKNEVTRLDVYVLARLCHALNCSITDLLEYIPPSEQDKNS